MLKRVLFLIVGLLLCFNMYAEQNVYYHFGFEGTENYEAIELSSDTGRVRTPKPYCTLYIEDIWGQNGKRIEINTIIPYITYNLSFSFVSIEGDYDFYLSPINEEDFIKCEYNENSHYYVITPAKEGLLPFEIRILDRSNDVMYHTVITLNSEFPEYNENMDVDVYSAVGEELYYKADFDIDVLINGKRPNKDAGNYTAYYITNENDEIVYVSKPISGSYNCYSGADESNPIEVGTYRINVIYNKGYGSDCVRMRCTKEITILP